MRRIFFQTIVCFVLLACHKETSDSTTPIEGTLAGKWRMISVKDDITNLVTTKPLSITGDVDITFTFSSADAGTMSGVTPTNTLNADFSTGSNSALSIPAVARSKTEETSWGQLFLDNVTYSRNFNFDNSGKLNISASTNKILTFLRQ